MSISIVGALAHKTSIVGANNPAFQISATAWNATIAASGVAPDGSILVRDSAQPDGWGWLYTALILPNNLVISGFNGASSTQLFITDTSQGLNLKTVALFLGARNFYVYAVNDNLSGIAPMLTMDRSGNTILAGTLACGNISLSGSGITSSVSFVDTSQALNAKGFDIYAQSLKLHVSSITDVGAFVLDLMTIDRSGNVIVPGTVSPTLGVVLSGSAGSPAIEWSDTSRGLNLKNFSMFAANGVMNLYTLNDAGVGVTDILQIDRSGNLAITGAATITGGFGCNGATSQTAAASGGALAGYVTGGFGLDSDAHMHALYTLVATMRAALVANGVMS